MPDDYTVSASRGIVEWWGISGQSPNWLFGRRHCLLGNLEADTVLYLKSVDRK